MFGSVEETGETHRITLEQSSLFLCVVSIEQTESFFAVNFAGSEIWNLSTPCSIVKSLHKMFKSVVNGCMELFLEIFKRKSRDILAFTENFAISRLMPFRPMSASNIDTMRLLHNVLQITTCRDTVEVLKEPRVFSAICNIFTLPMAIAEILKRKVEMGEILREYPLRIAFKE
jgi:hypothetical protein